MRTLLNSRLARLAAIALILSSGYVAHAAVGDRPIYGSQLLKENGTSVLPTSPNAKIGSAEEPFLNVYTATLTAGTVTATSVSYASLIVTGDSTLGDAATDVVAVTGKITDAFAPAADSATVKKAVAIAVTAPVDTTGTNGLYGLSIDSTIGNASGGTNTFYALNITAITGDAQVTESAINIGAGFDSAMTVGTVAGFPALEQNQTASHKMWFGTATVVNTATTGAVTLTGLSTSSKCLGTITNDPTTDRQVLMVVPTSNTATVTISGDPGATGASVCVVCFE